MKMVHGLKMQVLKLSLILVYLFSFNLNAKTLKVDTLTPNVTDGNLTIQRNGTGDIVIGDYTGFLKFLSGAPTEQASIDLTSDITGVLPVANGGTGSATQNFVDLTTNQSIAGDKTVTGQFVAISTTNGNRPCPEMTEAQRDAISSPISGDCIVNSTAKELNFYLDGAWSQIGGGGGGGGSAGINFVDDPSFENGDLAPDATALGLVSYELYTADSELNSEFNLQHYQVAWSSLSSADAYVRDSFSRTGLDEKQGLFSIWIKSTTVSDQELQLCLRVDDSDFSETCDDAYLLTITADDTWRKYEIPFIFGASTVEYEIFNESYTGALEINIDKVYVGTIPDGYIQQVGQASFVGSLNYEATSCVWNKTTTAYDDFPVDSDCDASSIVGGVSEPDTKIPAIKILNARTDGYYQVIFQGLLQYQSGGNCAYSLSSSSSYENQSEIFIDPSGDNYNHLNANFKFSTTGEKTIRVISQGNSTPNCSAFGSDGNPAKFTVHFYPDSNSTIVAQQTELTAATANELNASFDGSAGSSITTLTEDYAGAITCAYGGAVGAFDCTYNGVSFNEIPNVDCKAFRSTSANRYCEVTAKSTSGFSVQVRAQTDDSIQDDDFQIEVSKQGSDVNKSQTIVGKFANINDTPLCQVEATGNDGDSISANTEDIPFKTTIKDNCNAWSNGGNTGSDTNDQFTAPRKGYYLITGGLYFSGAVTLTPEFFVNGTDTYTAGSVIIGTSRGTFSQILNLDAGDNVTLRIDGSATLVNDTSRHHIQITELPDLSAIVDNLTNNPRAARDDQYSETEIPWGKWNGQQLYRRCFTVGADITSTSTIVTWAAALIPKNAVNFVSDNWVLNGTTDSGTISRIVYDASTGNVRAVLAGAAYKVGAGTSFCMDYTK